MKESCSLLIKKLELMKGPEISRKDFESLFSFDVSEVRGTVGEIMLKGGQFQFRIRSPPETWKYYKFNWI